MAYTKLGYILSPEWFEVISETDLATSVHLSRLAIQLWQGNLWGSLWIRHRNL